MAGRAVKRENKIYFTIRSLHLYAGLLVSPFILIFGISILVFNHGGLAGKLFPVKILPELKTKLDKIPADSTELGTAKKIISQLGINGEIDFITRNGNSISIPVKKPGLTTIVELNTGTGDVIVRRHLEGSLRGLAYLHLMPGQHNVKMRGNSVFMKIWRKTADSVVYLILFLSASGILLWYFLEPERRTGLYFIMLGIFVFLGLIILIFRY